ncbi:hypothetical protein MMC13_008163 [Lambiella insularis]|nr:hypothetical protein [Lambiella insularis]
MRDTKQKWKILKAFEQWDDWYDQTRSFFSTIGAWDYVDPDKAPQRTEPTEPQTFDEILGSITTAAITASAPSPAAPAITGTISDTSIVLSNDSGNTIPAPVVTAAIFDKALDRAAEVWDIKQQEMEPVHINQQTVDRRLHPIIDRERTLLAKFLAIQNRFKPTDSVYRKILLARYKKLQKLGHNDDVDLWVIDWRNLEYRLRKHPVNPLTEVMPEDFVTAVEAFDPKGGAFLQSRRKDDGDLPDLEILLDVYRNYYRATTIMDRIRSYD